MSNRVNISADAYEKASAEYFTCQKNQSDSLISLSTSLSDDIKSAISTFNMERQTHAQESQEAIATKVQEMENVSSNLI